ncbi:MAG: nucleotidyltransferase domain-containing protein [Dehalococcoidia bacterium]|nr:nucleotidyltransferase domain-containing protein [Dehalococcoidia bacterium]
MVTKYPEVEAGISDFVEQLRKRIDLDAVILFGSYASGTPGEWSDIDLAVISPDFEGLPIWCRQEIIGKLSVHRFPNLSPIGYPSSEYYDPGPHSFLREIIRTGRVVWQADPASDPPNPHSASRS